MIITKYLILIISQIVFSFSRTLNVRYTAKERIAQTLVTGGVIKIAWLVSSAIGINALINQDYITALIYVLSGLIGDYLSFKIKVK